MSAISTKIYAKDSSGTLRELQPETTISNVSGLQAALDGKVNTVSGKGLSTNDYTATEKNKLAGIANNANNYVHPTTSGNKHVPSGGSSGKILGWSADGTAAWIDEPSKGTVTSVKVGNTAYNPSSGVVSLPAYPTDTNTHRPIQVNGTQILGDNTTPLNLKAGSNVSILKSNGTVTIAATDTTYSAATQSANGLMSSSDKTKLDGIDSSSSTFSISRYSASYTVDTTTWKFNGMAWFTILITNSSQINANTSVIPAYVPSDLKPKGSRDINLVCDVDNKYCRAWITGGSQYIYLRPTEIIPANSNIRITGSYPY